MARKPKARRRNMRDDSKSPKQDRREEWSDNKAVKDTERSNTFGGNAIEWFSRYPNLLLAAGSIPYPYKPGMSVPFGQISSIGATSVDDVNYTIPGIMTINWIPSVGYSDGPTSPISIVGKEVYAKVREKFSGALDADAPDFVIYFLALDSIFGYIANLKRIYRTLNAYSPENLFTPDGILTALGISQAAIQDLRQHKMEFYQRINELVLMTRKFKCPRIMDLFNRHVWLNDHVYTDAPTVKAQMYCFRQMQYFMFSMVDVPNSDPTVQAGGLVLNSFNIPDTNVVEYCYTFGRNLINALASSDDGYLISGYLMRAYEGYPDFVADELLIAETLIPKYNEEVLGEIENSHSLPYGTQVFNFGVSQDPATNAIICKPTVQYQIASNTVKMRLDLLNPRFTSRSDMPTVAETVINSRMSTYIGEFQMGSTMATADVLACSEIITDYILYTQYSTTTGLRWTQVLFTSEHVVDLTHGVVKDDFDALMGVMRSTQWDWSPILYVCVEAEDFSRKAVLGDVHNVTTISKNALKNINTVCLYSLFNAFSA